MLLAGAEPDFLRPPRSAVGLVRRHALVLGCFVVCLALSALPILVSATPPIVDYPNHLSRAHILVRWAESELYQELFRVGGLLIPNVLADIVTVVLAGMTDTLTAGRILLLLTLTLTLSGAWALNAAATGRSTIWPLFVAVLLFNEMFFWGFLNYLVGLGLLLWGLAAWLFLEQRGRVVQLAAGAVFALLVFLAHLVAFGLFAVAIALIELMRVARHPFAVAAAARRLLASAAVFAPTLVLFAGKSSSRELPLNIKFNFDPFLKLSPLTRLLSSGNVALDLATLLALVAALGFLLISRRVVLEPRLAAIAAAFLVLMLVLPYTAMGSFFLDTRIGIAAAMLGVAAIRPERIGRTALRAAAAFLVALTAFRGVGLAIDWQAHDRFYEELLAGFDRLPADSLVVPSSTVRFESAAGWLATRSLSPPEEHAASYATIRRDAVVPNIFARAGQNPLVFAPSDPALKSLARNLMFRVRSDDDLARLIGRLRDLAATGDPLFGEDRLFLLVFHRACREGPSDPHVHFVHCGRDFSLIGLREPPAPQDLGPVFIEASTQDGEEG